jgi:hypothetical protein
MKQTRFNVFETNSSSTHSICISKESHKNILPSQVEFRGKDFGWEEAIYTDVESKASYIYTLSIDYRQDSWFYNQDHTVADEYKQAVADANAFEDKVTQYLKSENISCSFNPNEGEWVKFNGEKSHYMRSIDHSDMKGCIELLHYVLESKENLFNYLFNLDSYIITGNDNDGSDVNVKVDYPHETFYKGN